MAKTRRRPAHRPAIEIPIIGELFEESEQEIVRGLLDAPKGSRVTLYIDSAGGSVYSALSIATLIRVRKLRASAIVLAECSSSAVLVFAACPERWVTPRSVFLFHRVKWRSEKDVRSEEASNWALHFRWLEDEIDRYQSALFGIPSPPFPTWIQEGRFVAGRELVDLGLAKLLDDDVP